MSKDPGYIVITKTGKKGRTYHKKEPVNGKIPVYLYICHICGGEGDHTPDCGAKVLGFTMVSERAILCDSETLKLKGFID